MRIFVTGISGLLGSNFALQLRQNHQITGSYLRHPFSLPETKALRLDVTSRGEVVSVFAGARPELVIHTAGMTTVDDCETDEGRANEINSVGALNVAIAAQNCGAQMVHISTDHLWDGQKEMVVEQAAPTPLNAYARSKLLAEQQVLAQFADALIVRTNFFGWGTTLKRSLAEWVLAKLARHEQLRMFNDVYITPILINDLVDIIMLLAAQGASGVYNVCGRDRVSKYEFGKMLAAEFGYEAAAITPISVKDFPLVAERPSDMSLSSKKVEQFLGRLMPPVIEGVRRMVQLEKQGWPHLLVAAVSANVER